MIRIGQIAEEYLEAGAMSSLIGVIAGLSQANNTVRPYRVGFDVYRQGFAASMSQSA
jgi:hypothetical protein